MTENELTTRRQFVIAAGGIGLAAVIGTSRCGVCDDSVSPVATATEALARLKEGNQRFVSGKTKHHHTSREWRESLASGQTPFAVIVGCADSRVPIALVFDQGFGDLNCHT